MILCVACWSDWHPFRYIPLVTDRDDNEEGRFVCFFFQFGFLSLALGFTAFKTTVKLTWILWFWSGFKEIRHLMPVQICRDIRLVDLTRRPSKPLKNPGVNPQVIQLNHPVQRFNRFNAFAWMGGNTWAVFKTPEKSWEWLVPGFYYPIYSGWKL